MKKVICVIIVLAALYCASASADMVEGEWTGTGQAMGRTVAVSAGFDGRGGFTAFGMGMNVAGSYTLYDDAVTLEAENTSISFMYSTDGSTETLTGSITYMGVSGTITLSRDVAAQPVTDTRAADETPVEDIFAVWSNDDRMSYTLAFYQSGLCEISLVDTRASDDNLLSEIAASEQSQDGMSITSLMRIVENISSVEYKFAGKFETEGKTVLIRLLDADFKYAPDSFLTPSWDEATNTLTITCLGASGRMKVYNAHGKALEFTASPLKNDAPNDERLWRYTAVSKGDRGDEVKLLQEKLIEAGYLSDKADGIFGNKTRLAIEALQEKNGLEKTGVADESVWDILLD